MTDIKKTILLVEDEVIIALTQEDLLKKRGYHVVLSHDGENAVEVVRSGRPIDLVLMDIDLGRGMDGTEAAALILRDHDLPVVFLSSHTEPEIVEKTDRITSYGYVVKNTGATVIAASIKMAFRLYEAHQVIKQKQLEIEAANDELIATVEELEATNEEFEVNNEELIRSQNELMEQEQALRASETTIRSIFTNLPLGIHRYRCGIDGRLVFEGANPAADAILGVDNSQFIGKTIDEAFPQLSGTEVPERYKTACAAGTPWHTEQIVYQDEMIAGAYEVHAFQTEPGRMVALFADVTERKRAEAALRKSEKLYNNLVETAHDLIWRCDDRGRYVYLNRAWEAVFGYRVDEMLGRPFTDFMEPDTARRDVDLFGTLLSRDGYVFNHETVHLKKDGSPVYLNFNAVAVLDDSGTVTGTQGTAQDITEGRLAAETLKKSEEKFSKSFIANPAGLCTARLVDGVILEVNDAWLRITGFRRDEVVGHTPAELKIWTDPADRERIRGFLTSTGSVHNLECSFRVKNGDIRTSLFSAEIIDINDETCMLISILDLTERKNYETELASAVAEKESLLKELHHRVKNSFAIAAGIISLEADRQENPEFRQTIEDIRNRINSLADLYDILHQEQETREIRMDHYLERMGESLRAMYAADSERITLRMEIDNIRIDVRRAVSIGLIMNELFTNAMKYAFTGGRKGTIRVELRKKDNTLTLSVIDDGIGIGTVSRTGKQKGLGMELVRLLVQQLKGAATWKDKNGTTALVTFSMEE